MNWHPHPPCTSHHLPMIVLLIVLVPFAQSTVLVNEEEQAYPISSEDTRMVEVRDPPPCCKEGSFHSTDFFASILESPLGEKIKLEYGLAQLFCATGEVALSALLTEGDRADLCQCDCWEGHLARFSDFNCSRNYPCGCHYKKEDEDKFPTSKCDTGPLDSKSTSLEETDSAEYNERRSVDDDPAGIDLEPWNNSRLDLLSCPEVFSTYFTVLCSPILDNGNDFYTYAADNGQIFKIYPEDVCSLDCRFTHGHTKTRPYGRCCTGVNGVSQRDSARYYCHCLD